MAVRVSGTYIYQTLHVGVTWAAGSFEGGFGHSGSGESVFMYVTLCMTDYHAV